MRIFPLALIAVVALMYSGIVPGDERTPPQATALESFVAKPGVVERLNEIGSVRSDDAIVTVAVVIAFDPARAGERMKGVRFVMENNTGSDRVYLDRAQLALLIEDLRGIEGGIAELEVSNDAPYRVQGTAACWRRARPARILCLSYRIGPDWAGMTISAYGGPVFEYPGQRPSKLAVLVRQAVSRLGEP